MTLDNRRLSHDALTAHLRSTVIEILGNLIRGYAEEVDDPIAPSVNVFRTDFEYLALPPLGPNAVDDGLSEVVGKNKQLLNEMFKELRSQGGSRNGNDPVSDCYLWAISGVGFPEMDGTQVSGKPFIHTLMLVPSHLQAPLKDWVSRQSSSAAASSSGPRALITGFENLGSTEAAISRATDHVVHFIRAWSPIVDRDDIKEKFLTLFTDLDIEPQSHATAQLPIWSE